MIKQIQDRENKAIQDYLFSQPEMKEQEFETWMQEALERDKNANICIELAIYRINRDIPPTLSFQQKKLLLLQRDEWKLQSFRHGKSYKADDLCENNIQGIIDDCGRYFGMIKMQSIQKLEWVSLAIDKKICKIYIPTNNSSEIC